MHCTLFSQKILIISMSITKSVLTAKQISNKCFFVLQQMHCTLFSNIMLIISMSIINRVLTAKQISNSIYQQRYEIAHFTY